MIISTINEKGGVGKTTLSVHLAGWLKKKGIDVALVDADVQGGSSLWLEEAAPEIAVERFLSRSEVLKGLDQLSRKFAVVVVDGPGGMSESSRAALLLSDLALIPCAPSILDLRASAQGIEAIEEARIVRKGSVPEAMFVPNKTAKGYRLSSNLLELSKELGITVTPELRNLQAYAKAAQEGKFVWDLGRPGDDASIELHRLFQFIQDHYDKR